MFFLSNACITGVSIDFLTQQGQQFCIRNKLSGDAFHSCPHFLHLHKQGVLISTKSLTYSISSLNFILTFSIIIFKSILFFSLTLMIAHFGHLVPLFSILLGDVSHS